MYQLPQCLYLYQSKLKYTLNVIKNNEIYFSDPSTFNDIFDCSFTLNYDSLRNVTFNQEMFRDIIKLIPKNFGDSIELDNLNFKNMYEAMTCLVQIGIQESLLRSKVNNLLSMIPNQKTNYYRVACFSESCDSELMWAHYGKHLNGFCLCFDTNKDKHLFENARKVLYSNYRLHPNINHCDFLFSKSLAWSYEKEWRIVNTEKIKYYSTTSCTGIIIGEKVHKKTKGKLIREALKKGISIWIATADNYEYKIQILDLRDYYSKKESLMTDG